MLAVIHHPEAEAELIAAAKFYNDRIPGLGADPAGGGRSGGGAGSSDTGTMACY
jgi:hypothetical protein